MGKKKQKLKQALEPIVQPLAGADSLLDDLLSQLDATAEPPPASGPPPPPARLKKPSRARFAERLERKSEARAAMYGTSDPEVEKRLEAEIAEETQFITNLCADMGLELHEVQPDGHCLFSAIADQLLCFSLMEPSKHPHLVTRKAAADYIMSHPDDFLPFLPSPEGEDGRGASSGGLMTLTGLEHYCLNIRDTSTWGGEPEILALSKAFSVPIHVVQHGTPPVVVHSPFSGQQHPTRPIAFISYHRRMYGLGEHYNSLRPRKLL